jgi:integrase
MGRKRAAGNERLSEYVQRRQGGQLELRFPLPVEVRGAFLDAKGKPRSQIIRSLGTSDVRLGNAKADLVRAQLRQEVMTVLEARRDGSLGSYLTWLYDFELEDFRLRLEEDDTEKRRAFFRQSRKVTHDFRGPTNARLLRSSQGAALTSDDPVERHAVAGWAADWFYERQGVVPDPSSPAYRDVVDRCAEVLADTVIAKEELHNGRPEPRPTATVLKQAAVAPQDLENALTDRGRLPISSYFDGVYAPVEDREGSAPKGERNIAGKRHSISLFRELVGNKPICSIKKGMLYEFLDKLVDYPSVRVLTAEQKKLGASTILRRIRDGSLNLPAMSPKTANKHLSNISAVLQFAERRRDINGADSKGVKTRVEDGDDGAGRSFTTAELNRLFSLPLFAGCAGEDVELGLYKPGQVRIRDDRFWIPLVLFFTGGRSGEIAGLLTAEAVIDHEVPHFIIQPNHVRRLKNRHSRRMVPIHRRLIDMGILDFIRGRIANGDERLFPMAEETTYREGATGKTRARPLSSSLILRQFNRTILDHADATDDGGSIKCFRNTFEQEAASKIVSDEIKQRLTGRKVVSTSRIYTENIPYDPVKRTSQLLRLRGDIDQITYDGVVLDQLLPKDEVLD